MVLLLLAGAWTCSIIQHYIDYIQTPLEFEICEIFIDAKDSCCKMKKTNVYFSNSPSTILLC